MKKLIKKSVISGIAAVLSIVATIGVVGPTCFMGFYQPELPKE